MKKTAAAIALFALFLTAFSCCGNRNDDNITFWGQILEVDSQTLLISTDSESVSFDKVSVNVSEVRADFDYAVGQTVEVTILPQIAESDPPQATAVSIKWLSPMA